MQWRLVAALRSGDEGGARTMLQEASTIVLYDVVFCIYVLLFAAGVIFCCLGIGWWQTCDVDSWNPFWAAFLLLIFGLWSIIFSCCWGFSLGCWGFLEGLGVSSSVGRLFFGTAGPAGPAPTPPRQARQSCREMARAELGPVAAQAFQGAAPSAPP
ncbi:ncsA [Symbiodinium natans]|uniref:NcsA protein n=1 Tax=Symbiodinium natans TaxID=878477 RepID=A0A812S759_9DINO|nr:ncsA [Symbiodinium natans]